MSAGKKIWSLTWRILIGVLLLGWIFHAIFTNEAKLAAPGKGIIWNQLSRVEQWETAWRIGPIELWHTLVSVNFAAFVLSLLLVGLMIFLGMIRWRMVLAVQGLDLSIGRATEISFVAHFFNSFLLGSTGGDLMKAYYAARETHHKKTEAVTTVFVDRLIGLWSMLFFAALMMLANWRMFGEALHTTTSKPHVALQLSSLVVLGMLFALSVILVVAFWGGVSKRWPSARAYMRRLPKGELLERSLDSCRQFGTKREFLLHASLISLLINVLCAVQVIVLARGLHLDISPLALFAIVPIVICISSLPITPSGLGVRENLFVLLLALPLLAVPATPALSLSLLVYAGGLFWSIIGGVVYLCVKETQHLSEIANVEATEEIA